MLVFADLHTGPFLKQMWVLMISMRNCIDLLQQNVVYYLLTTMLNIANVTNLFSLLERFGSMKLGINNVALRVTLTSDIK